MSKFNPSDIERAALDAFKLSEPNGNDVFMKCKRCGAFWDDIAGDKAWYHEMSIMDFIDKAWDHFIGGCK